MAKAFCHTYQLSQERGTWCIFGTCSLCCTGPSQSSRITATVDSTNCCGPPSQPRDLTTPSCWYKESYWGMSGPAGIKRLTGRGAHWLDQILWLPGHPPWANLQYRSKQNSFQDKRLAAIGFLGLFCSIRIWPPSGQENWKHAGHKPWTRAMFKASMIHTNSFESSTASLMRWFGMQMRKGPHWMRTSTSGCDEITVRLMIPGASNRGQWNPTVAVGYVLTLIAVRGVSPRGLVGMLAYRVLLGRKWSDDNLGTHQHRDQHSGCPTSMPNLARPWRLCPGMTWGWAAWGPTPTRKSYSAMGVGISNHNGRKGFSMAGSVAQGVTKPTQYLNSLHFSDHFAYHIAYLCCHMTVRLMSGPLNSHYAPVHMTKSSITW